MPPRVQASRFGVLRRIWSAANNHGFDAIIPDLEPILSRNVSGFYSLRCRRWFAAAVSNNFLLRISFFFLTMSHSVLYSIVRLYYKPVCKLQLGSRLEEACHDQIDVRNA